MIELTKKQEQRYHQIKNFINANRISPSLEELSILFNVSIKCASDVVKVLKKKGWIDYQPNKARTIRIIKESGGE